MVHWSLTSVAQTQNSSGIYLHLHFESHWAALSRFLLVVKGVNWWHLSVLYTCSSHWRILSIRFSHCQHTGDFIHQCSMQHYALSVVTLGKILLLYDLTVETVVHCKKTDFWLSSFNQNCQPDIPLKNRTVWSKTGQLATLNLHGVSEKLCIFVSVRTSSNFHQL